MARYLRNCTESEPPFPSVGLGCRSAIGNEEIMRHSESTVMLEKSPELPERTQAAVAECDHKVVAATTEDRPRENGCDPSRARLNVLVHAG